MITFNDTSNIIWCLILKKEKFPEEKNFYFILNDTSNIIWHQIILNDTLNINKNLKDTLIAEKKNFLRRKIFSLFQMILIILIDIHKY